MAIRTVYLVSARNTPWQRAHFSIFVPSAGTANPALGTIIHVVGAPMAGYSLEFKRNYAPELSNEPHTMVPIGSVDESNIVDHASADTTIYSTPRGNLEIAASRIPPPRISQNFMAPVNDTTNRRCQEWTTEYVRRLVELGYISAGAIDIVQSLRDPPNHGIGLRRAG
ncbi:hypothetical protein MMC24_002943 [Lignoscripta atroalba]|nr:hypothetical protein [Lignoscripta atroalba]